MAHWIRVQHQGRERFGLLDGERVRFTTGSPFGEHAPSGESARLSETKVLTPVTPSKMVALWNNFRALAEKLGNAIPPEPLYFLKANNSFLAHEETIRMPASYAGKVIYEGELGVVIGKRCAAVSEADAPKHILGYTCINDVTAFDVFNKDPSFPQWVRAKSFDTYGPFGPCIATGLDWSSLRIRTVLNGAERQNYPASDMILPPSRIVSLISREMTLLPGDVIACGTSVGVGSMKPGSIVEVSIEGIGVLKNTVAEAPAPA